MDRIAAFQYGQKAEEVIDLEQDVYVRWVYIYHMNITHVMYVIYRITYTKCQCS